MNNYWRWPFGFCNSQRCTCLKIVLRYSLGRKLRKQTKWKLFQCGLDIDANHWLRGEYTLIRLRLCNRKLILVKRTKVYIWDHVTINNDKNHSEKTSRFSLQLFRYQQHQQQRQHVRVQTDFSVPHSIFIWWLSNYLNWLHSNVQLRKL